MGGPSLMIVANAFPSVDTFFFLSGLLVGYLTFVQLHKKKFNLVVFYVHRYIRQVNALRTQSKSENRVIYEYKNLTPKD